MRFSRKEDFNLGDELSFRNAVWAQLKPFLVARTVDTALCLTLWASLLIAHFAQLAALSIGWFSPGMVRALDLIETCTAFASIVAFLLMSSVTFLWLVFLQSKKEMKK
jgi:hypothetical protein